MTKPVWSLVLAPISKTSSYNQLPGSLSPDYKYLHASQILHKLS